jgi:hypothetical protein
MDLEGEKNGAFWRLPLEKTSLLDTLRGFKHRPHHFIQVNSSSHLNITLMSLGIEKEVSKLDLKASPDFDFSIISPAILELITEYLTGIDILSMYFTCCRALRLRMNAGGVKKFVILRDTPLPTSWQFAKWTSLASFSQLQIISIQVPSLYVWTRGYKLFDYFPKSLKSLEVLLPVHFGDYLSITAADLVVPRHAKKSIAITNQKFSLLGKYQKKPVQPERKQFADFAVSRRLPLLERFRVQYTAKTNNSFLKWSNTTRNNAIQKFVESLPLTVTHLAIPRFVPNFAELNLPSLGHLEMSRIDSKIEMLQDWKDQVPANLTRLQLSMDQHSIGEFVIPTLEYLQLTLDGTRNYQTRRLGADFWNDLSQFSSLTRLEIDTTPINADLTELFSHLPKSLRRLRVDCPRPPALLFHELPPKLTHLDLHLEAVILSTPPRFPSSMRSLLLRRRFPLTPEDILHLPRELEVLSIDFRSTCWAEHRKEASEMPALTDDCASALPQNLKHLHVSNTSFGPSFFQSLPESLTKLKMETSRSFDAKDLSCLPESLVDLHLMRTGILHQRALDNLPAGLTRLFIDQGKSIDSLCISRLPRFLLHLSITENTTLDDSCAKDLPRELMTLCLPYNQSFTASCAAQLPRFLSLLELRQILMPHPRPTKSALLSSLPHSLNAYELPWVNAKNRKVDISSMS